MKWITLFAFILNNIFIVNISYAVGEDPAAARDAQEVERFRKEAEGIYGSLNGLSTVVPFEAFLTGYTNYFKYKKQGRLNNKPIMAFVNFSIPSASPRFAYVNFGDTKEVFITLSSHGVNSSSEGGRACERSRPFVKLLDSHKFYTPMCNQIYNVPAVAFDMEDSTGSTGMSEIGFLVTGSQGYGSRTKERPDAGVGDYISLTGLEKHNQDASSRSILLHDGGYVRMGANSAGCFVLPPDDFARLMPLMKNGMLLYAFTDKNITQASTEEIKEVAQESKTQQYEQVPASTPVKSRPEFEETSLAKAEPSMGALSKGILAIGAVGAVAAFLKTKKSNKEEKPTATGTLKGSTTYEKCQSLSNASWADTTEYIKQGGDPSVPFRGSWSELHRTLTENGTDNGEAIEIADERAATINDCVASAHISTRTDFTKENINQPDKKSSADGSITCVYEGPESQDYQPCLKAIEAHDALLANEQAAHKKQEEDYKSTAAKKVATINLDNAQAEALAQASALQSEHSTVALERAEISSNKIDQLAAVASRIPTIDSLYDECKANFAKHGTVSINEYNEFAKIYDSRSKPFTAERDYCLNAVSNGTRPVNNANAREQIKQVLKKFGREMDEYTSKSGALKDRAAKNPSMGSSSFAATLTDINFTTGGPGKSVGGYGRDGALLMYNGGSQDGKPGDASSYNGALSNSAGQNTYAGASYNGLKSNTLNSGNRAYGGSGSYEDYDGGLNGSSGRGSAGGSGIYDEDFHNKINMALQNPGKLNELKLSSEQLKEYEARKKYNESLARAPASDRSPAGKAGDVYSNAGDVKDERPVDISAKEMNIFDIISSRYTKKFSEDPTEGL